MMKVLLTAYCAVSFGIVHAQTVPTVAYYIPAVAEVPTVAYNIPTVAEVPTVTLTSSSKPFYEQLPLVSNIIDFARKHLSTRYRSGGTSTGGFDCSGFTRFCFSKFGLALPHSSTAQGSVGHSIDKTDAQPGDLILFKGHSAGGSRIGHVGLITEVIGDRVKFIHSAWNGGVRYDYLHADYYQRRFMGIRRVIHLIAEK